MAALWDEMMMGNSTRRAVPGSAFEFLFGVSTTQGFTSPWLSSGMFFFFRSTFEFNHGPKLKTTG